MKNVENIEDTAAFRRKCVLAVGMFDGLHKGHKKVVGLAKRLAKKHGAAVCVLTFSPHPSAVIDMGRPPVEMLFSGKFRAELFAEAGVEKVFVKKFTKKFAALTPDEFAEMLAAKFPNLKGIATGYNFVFGRGAEGNARTLRALSKKYGWQYISANGVFLPDGRRVSSSEMRNAVRAGNMAAFAEMRGDFYKCSGALKGGKKLGRKIGFPTLNLPWNPDCKPKFGVYFAELRRVKTGRKYAGVANYGTSPTVGKTEPLVEMNLFKNVSFGAPEKVEIRLKKFLRPQRKFESLDALVRQIKRDKLAAQALAQQKKTER